MPETKRQDSRKLRQIEDMKIENVSLYGSIPVNDNGSSENRINFKMSAKEITLDNTIHNKLM